MSQRPIIAFDLDFTLHRGSLVVLLLQVLGERGIIPRDVIEHASVLEHKTQVAQGLRRDYAYAMLDQFISLNALEGIPEAQMYEIAEELLVEHRERTMLFSRLLLESAKKQGYVAVAISGSPKQIVDPFAKAWGFDDWVGTEFLVNDQGQLTGKADEWILHYKDKAGVLERFVAKHNCTWKGSIAIGDSMDDASMMKSVEYPMAMNPSNELRHVCRELQIPFALEQGDGVLLMRSSAKDGYFQEVDVSTILPSAIAADIYERSEKRVCRLNKGS